MLLVTKCLKIQFKIDSLISRHSTGLSTELSAFFFNTLMTQNSVLRGLTNNEKKHSSESGLVQELDWK